MPPGRATSSGRARPQVLGAALLVVALALLAGCAAPPAATSARSAPSPAPATDGPRTGPVAPVASAPAASAGTSAAITSAPTAATPAGQIAGTALFDAHIHYSQDAWSQYDPAAAVEILRRAGIRRTLVSSTPDEGTMRLYERAPDLVVPVLRPYRTRDDIGSWTRDGTVVRYVEATYRRGVHRGIGEFHIAPGDAATPVMRAIVALAVREDLWLHAHADERAVAELARSDPRAKVIWAHAGMTAPPAAIGALLDEHPMLMVEVALRGDILAGDGIDPGWRELLVRHADRFMVGTDTWVPSRWEDVVAGHERTRRWLAQLPPEAATKIALGNADRLFGAPR